MLLFFANFILCIHFSHRFLLSALDGQVFTMSPKLGSCLSFPCAGNMGGRHRVWFSPLKWFFRLHTWYKPSGCTTLSNLIVTVSPHSQRKCSFSLTSGSGRRIEVHIFLCSHCRETHFWWICMFIVSTLEKKWLWERAPTSWRVDLKEADLNWAAVYCLPRHRQGAVMPGVAGEMQKDQSGKHLLLYFQCYFPVKIIIVQ